MNGRRKSGAGRPRKACSTCKTQKIRCTEERPSCKRCVRLHHACTYDSGPLIKRRSKPLPHLEVQRDAPSKSAPSPQRGHTAQAHAAHAIDYTLSQSNGTREGRQYIGLLEHLLPELVDIYFNHVYNAHLLLHRSSFLAAIAGGTACPHVVLSICAWGAKFYEDPSGLPVLKTQGFMLEWAQSAGKLVFQDAEELAWDNILTFMNLALFWHSQGSWRRSYLYKGNAFLLLDLLGLGPKPLQFDKSLESEVRRRRFWACYIMHCHTSENGARFEPKVDVLKLPLPWSDRDFDSGTTRRPQVFLSSEGSDDSIFAALIKGSSIWHSVVSLLTSPEMGLQVKIPTILALDERVQKWWQTVPSDLKLTPRNVKSIPPGIFTRVLHINTLYHQSLCALHASLVPLFCCSPGDGWSATRQLSAQVAFEHAGEMSSLIAAILETASRKSGVPMFMGYAAYCGCAIQIPFMWCSNSAIRERIHANISANSRLLQLMTVDWKLASILSAYIHYLCTLHSKRAIVLEDEPMKISRDKLAWFHSDGPGITHSSIFEYISRFRTEGGGYGDAENSDRNVTGNMNASPPGKTTHKPLKNSDIGRGEPTVFTETREVSQNGVEHPIIEIGSMTDLLYPITTEAFNFAFDDEMTDLPLFNMDQLEFSSFNTAS